MSKAAAATAEGGIPPADAKGGGKKKLLLIAAPALILLLVAGLWFSGILPNLLGMGHKEEKHGEAEVKPLPTPVFLELPEMVANLNGNPKRPSFVKLRARVELSKASDLPIAQAAMPRLQDLFQTYLRETRPEDLRGSAGTYRLREELIARGNLAVHPARITDLLFTEMLVQ